jgi:uncharacterized protein (UPF0332 family)
MIDQQQLFLVKAEESLEGAESEFGNHRYNNVANRAYYACFQGATYALVQAGVASVDREQWPHEFVQGQFVLQLINRRKVYPGELRDTLSRNLIVRQRADYEVRQVTEVEARRALDRTRRFLAAIRTQRG